MILVDLSQVIISNLMTQVGKNTDDIDDGLIRHMILNSILNIKKKFSGEYGNIVICCDNKNYWRKDIFPFYKFSRKKEREDSGVDWGLIFNTMHEVKRELREHFPYKCIEEERAEADDIIAVIVEKYAPCEKILIISSDKDFKQLQKYPNVSQYSPILKKFLKENDPTKYLREHIIRGDKSDGIPNFLSEDEVFVENRRQRPITKKNLSGWLDMSREPEDFCDANMIKYWKRNEALVDLSKVPEELKAKILNKFTKTPKGNMNKVFNYFVENRMMLLMEEIENFKEKEYQTYNNMVEL
jgi:hypothetical protein